MSLLYHILDFQEVVYHHVHIILNPYHIHIKES